MEPPPKRRRTSETGTASKDVTLEQARRHNDLQLKSRFESIFEKYSRDFTDVADEIDLRTGELLVNNGHLQAITDEHDVGILMPVRADREQLARKKEDESDRDELQDANDEGFRITLRERKEKVTANAVAVTIPQQEQETPPTAALVRQFGPAMGLQISQILTKLQVDETTLEPAWRTVGPTTPPSESLPKAAPISVRLEKNRSMYLLQRGSIWSDAQQPYRRRKSAKVKSERLRTDPSGLRKDASRAFGRDPFDSDASIYAKSANWTNSLEELPSPPHVVQGPVPKERANIEPPLVAVIRDQSPPARSLPRPSRARVKRLGRPWSLRRSSPNLSGNRRSICNRSCCGHDFYVEIISKDGGRAISDDGDGLPVEFTGGPCTPSPIHGRPPSQVMDNLAQTSTLGAIPYDSPLCASAASTTVKSPYVEDRPGQGHSLDAPAQLPQPIRRQRERSSLSRPTSPDSHVDQSGARASSSLPSQGSGLATTIQETLPLRSSTPDEDMMPTRTPVRSFQRRLEGQLSSLSTPDSRRSSDVARTLKDTGTRTDGGKSISVVMTVQRTTREGASLPQPLPKMHPVSRNAGRRLTTGSSGAGGICGEVGWRCERAFCLICL